MNEEKDEEKEELSADELLQLRFENLKDESGDGELPPALRFLEEYFPKKTDMGSKTRLRTKDMPVNLSSLKVLGEMYPEIQENDMDETIINWMDSLEKRLISVDGKSREEFKEILEALLSGLRETKASDDVDSSIMRKLFTSGGDESGKG